MTQSIPKDVTLNDLAAMMARGFRDIDARFVRIEHRLDNLEDRLDKFEKRIDARLDDIEERLAMIVDTDILNLQNRVAVLERGFRTLGKKIKLG